MYASNNQQPTIFVISQKKRKSKWKIKIKKLVVSEKGVFLNRLKIKFSLGQLYKKQ